MTSPPGRYPIPSISKFFWSVSDIISLRIYRTTVTVPSYVSPKTVVTILSALTQLSVLAILAIGFNFPDSHPDRTGQRPPPFTRTVLPALTAFTLASTCTTLSHNLCQDNQLIFDIPQLTHFICRADQLWSLNATTVVFDGDSA
jgi:hypothetical protein